MIHDDAQGWTSADTISQQYQVIRDLYAEIERLRARQQPGEVDYEAGARADNLWHCGSFPDDWDRMSEERRDRVRRRACAIIDAAIGKEKP